MTDDNALFAHLMDMGVPSDEMKEIQENYFSESDKDTKTAILKSAVASYEHQSKGKQEEKKEEKKKQKNKPSTTTSVPAGKPSSRSRVSSSSSTQTTQITKQPTVSRSRAKVTNPPVTKPLVSSRSRAAATVSRPKTTKSISEEFLIPPGTTLTPDLAMALGIPIERKCKWDIPLGMDASTELVVSHPADELAPLPTSSHRLLEFVDKYPKNRIPTMVSTGGKKRSTGDVDSLTDIQSWPMTPYEVLVNGFDEKKMTATTFLRHCYTQVLQILTTEWNDKIVAVFNRAKDKDYKTLVRIVYEWYTNMWKTDASKSTIKKLLGREYREFLYVRLKDLFCRYWLADPELKNKLPGSCIPSIAEIVLGSRSDKQVSQYLKDVGADGNCFFRAFIGSFWYNYFGSDTFGNAKIDKWGNRRTRLAFYLMRLLRYFTVFGFLPSVLRTKEVGTFLGINGDSMLKEGSAHYTFSCEILSRIASIYLRDTSGFTEQRLWSQLDTLIESVKAQLVKLVKTDSVTFSSLLTDDEKLSLSYLIGEVQEQSESITGYRDISGTDEDLVNQKRAILYLLTFLNTSKGIIIWASDATIQVMLRNFVDTQVFIYKREAPDCDWMEVNGSQYKNEGTALPDINSSSAIYIINESNRHFYFIKPPLSPLCASLDYWKPRLANGF